MAEYTFLTNGGKSALQTGQAKAGTNVNSTMFIGYDSNDYPNPVVFADDIGWSIKSPDGNTIYRSTNINGTVITTTEDLIKYISELPTTKDVSSGIRAANSMVYKGSIGTSGTVTSLPSTPSVGDTYVVSNIGYIITSTGAFTTAQPSSAYTEVEPGDMIICMTESTTSGDTTTAATWNYILTNVTTRNLEIYLDTDTSSILSYNTSEEKKLRFYAGLKAEFDSTTSELKIGHSNSITAVTANFGIFKLKYDENGHITSTSTWDPNTLTIKSGSAAVSGAVAYDPDSSTAITFNFANGLTASYSGGTYTISNSGVRSITNKTVNLYDGILSINNNGTTSDLTVYTLPTTTSSVLGGVKTLYSYLGSYSIGTATSIGTDSNTNTAAIINSVTTTSNRWYAVTSDKDGHLFVNVPWTDTDTTVSASFTSSLGIEIAKFGPSGSQDSIYVPYATSSLYGLIKTGNTISSTTGYEAIAINNGVAYAKTNTWRPIYAYQASGNTDSMSQTLDNTITGTSNLAFGSEFLWSDIDTANDSTNPAVKQPEIHLAWAEVDSDGNITYVV